jgi:DNA-binding MarR family transcriptional regulator
VLKPFDWHYNTAQDNVVYKAKHEGAYEDKELTLYEMRVITIKAQGFTKNMTRKDVVRSLNMAASSIQATLKALIDKDFILENEDGFYVIDPGLATFAIRQVG